MKDTKHVSRNFTFDKETLELLDEIESFRMTRCPNYVRRWTKKSRILRDAIKLLYRYEVCEQSILHPKAANRRDLAVENGAKHGKHEKERNKLSYGGRKSSSGKKGGRRR